MVQGATYLLTAHLVSNKFSPITASDVWKDWANPIETDRGSYHIRIQAKTRLCVVRLLVAFYKECACCPLVCMQNYN